MSAACDIIYLGQKETPLTYPHVNGCKLISFEGFRQFDGYMGHCMRKQVYMHHLIGFQVMSVEQSNILNYN